METSSSEGNLREKIKQDLEEEEKLKFKFEREVTDEKTQKRKGFIQRLQVERREAGLDGVVLKAQEVASLQGNEIAQEERLAAELSLIRQQEIKEEKLRQYLRENSHELKELENHLKAAYANKILAAQIADNKDRKLREQIFEQRAREVMQNALGSQETMEKRAMLSEKKLKEEYRRTLQDQIIEKERIRQQEYMAFMKEKKLFEDTVQKIKDEEEKTKVEKIVMKQTIKKEMEEFNKARELWKTKERILLDKENERLQEIAKMKERVLEAERKEKKKNFITEERERYLQKMAEKLLAEKRLKEERSDMLKLIKEYESMEEERLKTEEELKKDLRRRRETRMEFQNHLAGKERKEKEEKELNMWFAKQVNLKVREEEIKEKGKNDSKRQERINDRKYNEEKIKQNIEKHTEDLKLTQIAVELKEEEEKKRARMIQEERIRILKEHAPHLLGYFPKGSLNETDLQILGITCNSPLPESNPFVAQTKHTSQGRTLERT